MHTPENRVKFVQAESEQLTQYLHALAPDAWSRPSACQRWAVRDVVGHLVLGAELYTIVVSRGLHGDTAPLQGLPEAGSVNAAAASSLLDQLSVARRESLGEQLLSTFNATSAQLSQLLAEIGPQDWETVCYHPVGLLPVWMFVNLRLTELVMHGWDIRSRFEPTVSLASESLPAFLDVLTAVVGWAFWPGPQPVPLVRYRFEATGTVPTSLDIVVAVEQARIERGGTARASVIFRCTTE